jgi:hypothetical protein
MLLTERKLEYTGTYWVLVLMNQCNEELRAKLLFLGWRIWHLRNNSIFGDGKGGIEHSAIYLQSYLTLFQNASKQNINEAIKGKMASIAMGDGNPKQRKIVGKTWQKPELGFIKLNVDARFSKDAGNGSWGAIARDDEGRTLLSAWGRLPHVMSREQVEALACLEGIKCMVPMIAKLAHLESDNLMVFQELKAACSNRSTVAGICSEVNNLLHGFPGFKISKISRSTNSVAHGLAKFSREMMCEDVLDGLVPPCVEDFGTKRLRKWL